VCGRIQPRTEVRKEWGNKMETGIKKEQMKENDEEY
jgi:hypothetical protein